MALNMIKSQCSFNSCKFNAFVWLEVGYVNTVDGINPAPLGTCKTLFKKIINYQPELVIARFLNHQQYLLFPFKETRFHPVFLTMFFFIPDLYTPLSEEIHGRRCMYAVLDPHWRNVGFPTVSLGRREIFEKPRRKNPPLPFPYHPCMVYLPTFG